MNFKSKFLTIILLSSVAAINAKVDAAPKAANSPQIVVVDLVKVGAEADTFKAEQEKIKKVIDAKVADVKKMEEKLQKNAQEFQEKASTMSDKKQQEEQQKLAEQYKNMQQKQNDIQQEVQTKMAALEKNLVETVKNVCEKLNLDFVLPGALYVNPKFDKTNAVITEINKNSKKSAKK